MIVDDSLSVHPTKAVFTSGLDLATISAGREIEGRVMSLTGAQALLAGRFGTLQVDLGTMQAAVGDTLRFEVQSVAGGDGTTQLSLTLVDKTSAPAANTAVAVDTPARALADAVGRAVTRQTGLAPLFASIAGLAAAPQGSVPEPVRTLVTQLMNARLGADGTANAAAVARGFQGSGLFLESRQATAAVAPSSDLKAGLLALGDALKQWVGTGASSTTAPTAGAGTSAAAASTAAPAAVTTSGGGATTRTDVAASGDASPRVVATAYGPPRPVQVPVANEAGATVTPQTAVPSPGVGASSPAAMIEAASETGPPTGAVPSPGVTAGAATAAGAGAGASSAAPSAASATVAAATTAATATGPSGASASGTMPAVATVPSSAALDEAAKAIAVAVMEALDGAVPPSVTAAVVQAEEQRARVDRASRPPPPRRGAAPRGQVALPRETATAGDGVEGLGRRTLERVDGALQRILLEQYAVLDRHDDGVAAAGARPRHGEWTADIPIATRDGTAVMQMTVERDGGRRGSPTVPEERSDWRVRFALDVEPVGPVTAQIGLVGEHLSIGLWIERPEAAAMLGDAVGQLRGALEAASIPVEAIHVVTGHPPEAARASVSGRFVDLSL